MNFAILHGGNGEKNPKSEGRNPKEIRKKSETHGSGFGFRPSDFEVIMFRNLIVAVLGCK